jgi:hypothetical protein
MLSMEKIFSSDILHRGKSASFFADPLPRAESTACYLEHANSAAR